MLPWKHAQWSIQSAIGCPLGESAMTPVRSTMTPTLEGTLLWQPTDALRHDCRLHAYMDWLAKHKQLHFDGYEQLWSWSTTQIEDFWASIWEFFDVQASAPYTQVLAERTMPGAQW